MGPNLWLSVTVKWSPYWRRQLRIKANGFVTHWNICQVSGDFGPSGSDIKGRFTDTDVAENAPTARPDVLGREHTQIVLSYNSDRSTQGFDTKAVWNVCQIELEPLLLGQQV